MRVSGRGAEQHRPLDAARCLRPAGRPGRRRRGGGGRCTSRASRAATSPVRSSPSADAVDPGRVGQRVLVDPALYDGPGPDARPVGLLGSEADGGFAQYVTVDAARAHDVSASPLLGRGARRACRSPTARRRGCSRADRSARARRCWSPAPRAGSGSRRCSSPSARGARVVALTSPEKEEAVREAGAAAVVHRGPEPAEVAAAVADGRRRDRSTPSSTSSAARCCPPCSTGSATAGAG